MHDALRALPRAQRRRALADAANRRKTGQWGPWKTIPLPEGIPGGDGWCREFRAVHFNKVFSVLERPAPGATHLGVSSLSGERPSWWEMQRIKNELAGPETTAVEVYPPQADVMDAADMFHIWVLPERPAFVFTAEARD